MTTPGYPDWERLVRAGGDFVAVSREPVPATVTLGPFNVQQWVAVMMWALTPSASDFYQITWNWFDDANMDNLLSSIFQLIGPNMELPLPVPVGGPWLQIVITPIVGGNNAVPLFTFVGISEEHTAFQMNTYSGPILRDNSNTPPSTVITFTGLSIHYGKALLVVNPPKGDITNVFFRFWNFRDVAYESLIAWDTVAAGTTIVQEIAMLAGPWQFAFTNTTTGQSVLVSLSPTSP